jgi:predicted ATP-dependent endonuclease of OLD family
MNRRKISFVFDGEEHSTSVGIEPASSNLLAQARRSDESHLAAPTLKRVKLRQALIDSDGAVVSQFDSAKLVRFTLESSYVDRSAGARERYVTDHFSSSLRDALREVKLSHYYDYLIENLQIFRPNIHSIESIPVDERDEPHIFERNPRVGYPLAFAGDGFQRLFRLSAAFASTKGGVVAIDEPEAFAHPGLFTSMANLLERAVQDGTQVFLATHSLELIEAVLTRFEEQAESVAVVGLANEYGRLDPVVIRGQNAHYRVIELGDDLRL